MIGGSACGARVRKGAAGVGAALVAMALGAGVAAASGGSGGIGSGGGGGDRPTSADGVFPIRGKHSYGDGLGAGRGHEGQDLLAKCGKPVVAAEPGRVQRNKFHSAAGNYVVIDGKGKIEDMAYMHLKHRSPLSVGEKVAAGDVIGRVGDTGDATACHLHFEIWSNPGWYEGGSPVDPAPSLHRWDRNG
jgi:murein DD-endopeptidase MepM/ murein hydrolase activator NlpD